MVESIEQIVNANVKTYQTQYMEIQMVDLQGQYLSIKKEMDEAILSSVESFAFINGPAVKQFQESFEKYLGAHVIPCANGTDALQIALMALDLEPGDEVIVPAFTYVATAEVIALLRLKPVMVDVDPNTFNVTADIIAPALTPRTKAVVPVHLFGQSCDMEPIMDLARQHGFYVVEDNAQAIGADYTFSDGSRKKTGTIGHIGCTSFYPSKNLGAYGDGGAMYTTDAALAEKIRMIANHGQKRRYYHDLVGVNSRLDSIQAAILNVKLNRLDEYAAARQKAADFYDKSLYTLEALQIPSRQQHSTHVFHQYTLLVKNGKRDALAEHLKSKSIPTMVYYPVPLYKQEAYKAHWVDKADLSVTERLCGSVLSLPMHTEMTAAMLEYITSSIKEFF